RQRRQGRSLVPARVGHRHGRQPVRAPDRLRLLDRGRGRLGRRGVITSDVLLRSPGRSTGGPANGGAMRTATETTGAAMSDAILEMRNIIKNFPGVKVLKDVSLSVERGEIHAICGENGA